MANDSQVLEHLEETKTNPFLEGVQKKEKKKWRKTTLIYEIPKFVTLTQPRPHETLNHHLTTRRNWPEETEQVKQACATILVNHDHLITGNDLNRQHIWRII